MKCPKCGKTSSNDDFCKECGHRLKKEVKKITLKLILGWIFGLLFVLVGVASFSESFFGGLLIIMGGLVILPPVGHIIKNRFHLELSVWLKLIAFLILIIIGISFTQSGEKQPITALETKELLVPETYSPCDFLPNKEVIPNEYKINTAKEENNTCMQQYYQLATMTTRFSISIHKFDSREDGAKEYNRIIEKIRGERGYTELKTKNDQCFAINKDLGIVSIVQLYCNWGNVLFEERIDNVDGYDSDILLSKIPQNVADKITNAALHKE